MANRQRVLVVDGIAETEEVLRAVLEPRGLRVDRVRATSGSPVTQCQERPRVVVIHIDEARSAGSTDAGWDDVPRIVIGTAKTDQTGPRDRPQLYLQKPFQYRELIQAIERLLAEDAA